jgi:NAD(P)-dependent dehydrogenase (short-subunit alcohol dehydrogenase family)
MAPVAKTTKSDLMQQIDMNFVTAFLCCRASVNAMIRTGAGGRIVKRGNTIKTFGDAITNSSAEPLTHRLQQWRAQGRCLAIRRADRRGAGQAIRSDCDDG